MNWPLDWKLPVGTSHHVWEYVNDPELARHYDEHLRDTPLLRVDLGLAEQFFPEPGSLIDLGCGTGRLLIPLAQRGFAVLGVDLSTEMLKVAAGKAAAAGLVIPLIRANLVELDCLRDQSFQYAACLFSTLGMISGVANRRRLLAHVFRILQPGGRFLLHVHNLWFHLVTPSGRRWLLRDRWRRMMGAADFGDFATTALEGTAGLSLHHFSRSEIQHELRRAGFRCLFCEPVGLRPDGRLSAPWFLPGWRAYGFLIGAERR